MAGVKRGDLFPPLKATLEKYNSATSLWEVIDLTAATGVTVYLRSRVRPNTVVTGACSIVSPATSGKVEYEWTAGDTALADDYDLEFKITWSGAKPQSVPGVGYGTYTIEPNLGSPE